MPVQTPVRNGRTLDKGDFLGKSKLGLYRPTFVPLAWYGIDGQARFQWWDIWRMRTDPQIQFILGLLKAPLTTVTWKVKSQDERVALWVDKTLRRFWTRDLAKADRICEFGSIGGELQWAYDKDTGMVEYHGFSEVQFTHAYPLQIEGKLAGVSIHGVGIKQTTQGHYNWLRPPRSFWVTLDSESGAFWGIPRIAGCWQPWREKSGRHGALDIRRLWFLKNVYRGSVGYHPVGDTDTGGGNFVANQDLMREIVEKGETGGVYVFPSLFDDKGNQLWKIDFAEAAQDIPTLREYPKDLDEEMLKGARIHPEVAKAAETGSGWAGRSLPFMVYLTGEDAIAERIMSAFDEQAIRLGVWANFGPKATYEIERVSLVPKPEAQPGKGNMGGVSGMEPGDEGQQDGTQPGQPFTGPRGGKGWKDENGKPHYGEPPARMSLGVIRHPYQIMVEKAAEYIDPNPSPIAREAKTFSRGHVKLHGMDIALEADRGSERTGTDGNGKTWKSRFAHYYGEIDRVVGADRDALDCFVGPNPESELVFVIDQNKPDGTWDEHKIMLGFLNAQDAKQGYLDCYTPSWKGFGKIVGMTMEQFKDWAFGGGDTSRPISKAALSTDASGHEHKGKGPGGGQFTGGGDRSSDDKSVSESSSGSDNSDMNKGKKTATTEEQSIAAMPQEHGFIISQDGDILATLAQSGDTVELALSKEEEAKCKDAIFTHNHPGGGSLSAGDFFQASRLNVAEMRVTTLHDGVVATHIIERPKSGWPTWDKINSVEHDANMAALAKTDEMNDANRFTSRKDARIFLSNEYARELAERLGIKYTTEQRKEAANLSMPPVRLAAAPDPWQPYEGKRGARKGQAGWRHGTTGRVVWGAKPQGRVAKDAAAKGNVASPVHRTARPTVEEMHGKITAALANKESLTPEGLQAIIDDMMHMTLADNHKLKAALNLKASGNKAEVVKKIAERALKPAEPKVVKPVKPVKQAPKEQPSVGKIDPHDTPAIQSAVMSIFDDLLREKHGRSGMVPIHEVRQMLAKNHGGEAATHEALDEAILGLWRQKKIGLEGISDLSQASQEQLSDSIRPWGDGRTILFYLEKPQQQPVKPQGGTVTPANPITPSKVAPQPDASVQQRTTADIIASPQVGDTLEFAARGIPPLKRTEKGWEQGGPGAPSVYTDAQVKEWEGRFKGGAPKPEAAASNAVGRIELLTRSNRGAPIQNNQVVDQVRQAFPQATNEQVLSALQQAWKDRAVDFHVLNEEYKLTDPAWKSATFRYNDKLMGYMNVKDARKLAKILTDNLWGANARK